MNRYTGSGGWGKHVWTSLLMTFVCAASTGLGVAGVIKETERERQRERWNKRESGEGGKEGGDHTGREIRSFDTH